MLVTQMSKHLLLMITGDASLDRKVVAGHLQKSLRCGHRDRLSCVRMLKYVAFDPSLHGSQPGTLEPSLSTRPASIRNFTMPIKPYESPRSTHKHQQFTPSQRSSTAPTLIYSGVSPASYARTADDALPRVKLQSIAATARPGNGWDRRRRPS